MSSMDQFYTHVQAAAALMQAAEESRDAAKRERDHAKELLSAKEGELAETKANLERAVADLTTSHRNHAHLQGHLTEANTKALLDNEKIRGLKERNALLETSLASARDMFVDTKTKFDAERQILAKVTAGLTAELESERLALQEANRHMAILQTDNTTLAIGHTQAEEEILALKQDSARRAASWNEERTLNTSRTERLTKFLSEAKVESDKEKAAFNELFRAKETVDAALNNAREENKALNESLAAAHERLKEVHALYAEERRAHAEEKLKAAFKEEVIREMATEDEQPATPPRRRIPSTPPTTSGKNRPIRTVRLDKGSVASEVKARRRASGVKVLGAKPNA